MQIYQRNEQFHRIDFLFYDLDLALALDLLLVAQLHQIQERQPLTQVVLPLQMLWLQDRGY